MKFPTYEEMARNVAEKALDEYVYEGKTIREWVRMILNAESCEDAISRQKAAIIQALKDNFIDPEDAGLTIKGEYWLAREVLAIIEGTEPKTGQWIYKQYGGYPEQGNYHCSECDKIDNHIPTYCPNCGAKMVEPQERSDKE